mmetsp:Transcript_68663/g.126088  ORF Transcript_68663/g.126088 Transcript_68663/m.126088 type:complete len:210 (+) Transcript_68663:801-1430(+)
MLIIWQSIHMIKSLPFDLSVLTPLPIKAPLEVHSEGRARKVVSPVYVPVQAVAFQIWSYDGCIWRRFRHRRMDRLFHFIIKHETELLPESLPQGDRGRERVVTGALHRLLRSPGIPGADDVYNVAVLWPWSAVIFDPLEVDTALAMYLSTIMNLVDLVWSSSAGRPDIPTGIGASRAEGRDSTEASVRVKVRELTLEVCREHVDVQVWI